MKFREILLVIVLLAAGFVVYQAQTGHWDFSFGWEDDFFGWGKEYTFEETQVIEAPLPSTLAITNSHGWVEVRGGDQETVQLTFTKRIWRRDEADARAIADRLHYVLDRSAGRLAFSTNRDEFRRTHFETGFVLTVPRRMSITVTNSYGPVDVETVEDATVRNRHGEISAARIEGPCSLETSYEDVRAEDLKSDCRIVNRHAAIRVLNAGGELHVDHAYGEVRFEDIGKKAEVVAEHAEVYGSRVRGPVTVETSYEKVRLIDVGAARVRARHCPVEADNVRGDLDVETTYEPVRVRNVQGNFTVTGNNVAVTASGVSGREISVTTSHEPVDLRDFSARVTVSLRHGNLILAPSELKFPVDVRDEYGSVDFYWPAGADAPLEARSRGGSIKWDLPGRPSVEKSNGTSLVRAFVENANGPKVFLSTTYGDIRLEEGGRKF
jgi:DUF4097 and DUF4098 domain-containing protein YvlB